MNEPKLGGYVCTGCGWVYVHNPDGWRHLVLDDKWKYVSRKAMTWEEMLDTEADCSARLIPLP